MTRVLFVCLGNICRSPMAEAVFMKHVREAGLEDNIEADSAGTGHWHVGERPHAGTRGVLEEHGIDHDHRARLVEKDDMAAYDYVIAMDEFNLSDLRRMRNGHANGHTTVGLLMEYAPHLQLTEVPDPYYDGRFDLVYELVDQATRGLLKTIRREKSL